MRPKRVADAAARGKKRKNKYLSMLEKVELIKELEIGTSALYIWNELARLCLHSSLIRHFL